MRIDPIELSFEIGRSPDDLFEYIRDFSHEPEWQADAIEVVPEPAGASLAYGSSPMTTGPTEALLTCL